MEFAIVGLVLRVVPLGVRVLQALHGYYVDVAEAPKKADRLRQELRTVIVILETLKETVEHSHNRFKGNVKVLEEALVHFAKLLEGMQVRVDAIQATGSKRLTWPFRDDTNQQYLDEIGRYKSTFILSLTTEN